MAERNPIKVYARDPERIELNLGEYQPRVELLEIPDLETEGGEEGPVIVQPTLPGRKIMRLKSETTEDLRELDVSERMAEVESTDAVEVWVLHGDRLERKNACEIIEAADRGDAEISFAFLQRED
jgi:hypothetical protein